MRTNTSIDAAHLRPVLVPWPARPDRRALAASEGRPCLLVVDPGADLPVPGELEDWVTRGASEIDVAARLEGLEAFARLRPAGPRPVVTVPDALSPSDRQVARALLAAAGFVVPRAQLVDDHVSETELEEAVDRVRRALAGSSWRIDRVPFQGYLAHTEDER